jgi:hypothetical protein
VGWPDSGPFRAVGEEQDLLTFEGFVCDATPKDGPRASRGAEVQHVLPLLRRKAMDRRELLGVLGAGTVGLLATSGDEARADHRHDQHDDHIKSLGQCARVCNEMSCHCLDKVLEGTSHKEEHARSHRVSLDCQAFCVLTATLLARGSELADCASAACAEACRCCAEACTKTESQDELTQECIKRCRECEKMCNELAGSSNRRERPGRVR